MLICQPFLLARILLSLLNPTTRMSLLRNSLNMLFVKRRTPTFLVMLRFDTHKLVSNPSNISWLILKRVPENDNLRDEYVTLFSDVQKDIPFARIALDKSPDAVNLWIGNSKSVTAMHKDNYENIYVQVLGRKHFVLLPSLCHPCVNEQPLRPATYKRGDDGLQLVMDSDDEAVPFAIWDPEKPEQNATRFSHLAKPLRVTLNPGDMLYLPAMW